MQIARIIIADHLMTPRSNNIGSGVIWFDKNCHEAEWRHHNLCKHHVQKWAVFRRFVQLKRNRTPVVVCHRNARGVHADTNVLLLVREGQIRMQVARTSARVHPSELYTTTATVYIAVNTSS